MNGQGLFLLSVLLSCTHVPLACAPQPGNAFPSGDIPPFDVRSHFARVMTLHGQGLYTGWEACGILLHRRSPPRYPIHRSGLLYTCTHPLFSPTLHPETPDIYPIDTCIFYYCIPLIVRLLKFSIVDFYAYLRSRSTSVKSSSRRETYYCVVGFDRVDGSTRGEKNFSINSYR